MQVHWPSMLLFAAAANMDSLVVGLSYGIRNIRISRDNNFIIGLVTTIGTIISMLLGRGALAMLPVRLANVVGGMIITIVGLAGFVRFFAKRDQQQQEQLGQLTLREALLLSFALAVNNIALGIGAGFTGMRVLPTAVCSLAASISLLGIGNQIGYRHVSKISERYTDLAASLLMVCLGLYEIMI